MAFDGITVAAVADELKEKLLNTRINKISQPENDELLFTIKGNSTQYRLLMSADASLPLIYLTEDNKTSPLNAPAFCMLLRKHIQNARIVDIYQPGLERVIVMVLEHLNEMGDLCRKKLIVELMGKHSNIIFCNEEDTIIDSIKHISGMVSSVREVLPQRAYFIPKTEEKLELLNSDRVTMLNQVFDKATPLYKAVYGNFTGISPLLAQEMCYRAGLDADRAANSYDENERQKMYEAIMHIVSKIEAKAYSPVIYYDGKTPVDYCAFPLALYENSAGITKREFSSVSALLSAYYAEKNKVTRMRQKTVDLRKIIANAIERNAKKLDLQLKQLKDSEKKDKYRIYGELLNAYGYNIEEGVKEAELLNYYDNTMIKIPLDPELSAKDNAKKYFDKYGKLKRTAEALNTLTKETEEELKHLETVAVAIDLAEREEDLIQVKEELIESGYIKRKGGSKKEKVTSRPYHYVNRDGIDIYVGKNNYQNDELTFKLATGNDWWFHAKGMPGSHVIMKTDLKEIPDSAFEDAARLAAYYSKGREQDKVEVDYIQKKNIKKPNGSKPGFVVYYTNYSMMADTDIRDLTLKNA